MNKQELAAAAALEVIQTEITKYVPAMFQSQIPAALLSSFATEVAKAVLTAVEEDQNG